MSRFCSIPAKPVRASKFYIFLIGPMLVLQYTEVGKVIRIVYGLN